MSENQRIDQVEDAGAVQAAEKEERELTKGPLRGLTPNVIRMGWVSFFADISSEMLYPVTPIFLAAVLGAPVAAIGLIEGVAEATASLLKTVAGRLSDLSGRRLPYVLGGYTLSALAKPLIALAHIWPTVLLARILDRLGKGLRSSPRDALIADSIKPEYRGRAFGWHRAMDTTGAVLGPLLAIFLLLHFMRGGNAEGLRFVFLLAFIPGLLGAALVLTVREKLRTSEIKQVPSIRFSALPPTFRGYLIAWGIFTLANSADAFLILRARSILQAPGAETLERATILVILVYTLYNLIYAVSSPWLGSLSDKLGRKVVLVSGLMVFALVYAGFAIASQAWHIWVLFAVYGLYTAATDGVGKALAVDLVSPGIRASAVGLLGTVTGVLTLAASSVAGLLWQFIAPWTVFAYGAAGALLGMLLLSRVPGKQQEAAGQ